MPALPIVLASALLASVPARDVRVHVSPGSAKGLADSAADVVRALSSVPGVTLVGSADDADVLVQLTERKRVRTGRVVPIPLATGMILLPVRAPQVVATVTMPGAGRSSTLNG